MQNPFFAQMIQGMHLSPKTILVLSSEQYETLGSPGIGHRIHLGISRE